MTYLVRTVFLQNYFTPSSEMAEQRRDTKNMNGLVNAMKRTELANQTLERELNHFAEKGLKIVSIIQHPLDEHHPHDLLVTVILSE